MSTIYGSIKLYTQSKRIFNCDCQYDIVDHVQIILKGRKYFKYLKVVYRQKTFYGVVPNKTTIADLFFSGIMTDNLTLSGVYIGYGTEANQVVECDSQSLHNNAKIIKTRKAAYYDEILFELDNAYIGVGTKHVDTVLKVLQANKILQITNVLQLVSKNDELQIQNDRLTKENTELSTIIDRNNNFSSDLADTVTNLEEHVRKLLSARDTFKQDIKTALQNMINTLPE